MPDKTLPPYCIPGRPLTEVGGVVVHYFSAKNVAESEMFDPEVCFNLFLDLNRAKVDREFYLLEDNWQEGRMYASAHTMIDRDGVIWRLIPFTLEAWHAGASMLNGRSNCNRWTLGIELLGTQTSGFTRVQYEVLSQLLIDLENEHGYDRENVKGHDAVRHAAIQAGAKKPPKYDPSGRRDGKGNNFDWYYLGKMMNDIKENPAGVAGLDDLDAVIEASSQSEADHPADR